ncbi:hypothetical protein CBFG_00410 [Clostridiales bacterium 1_7_47FAA]|nr:hypothetical protein CBFG_00410 [Clostridiales bacterium 1_7_47FAA]
MTSACMGRAGAAYNKGIVIKYKKFQYVLQMSQKNRNEYDILITSKGNTN